MTAIRKTLLFVVLTILSTSTFAKHHEAGENLAMALASESRAEADRARDAGRKPADVIAFLGIHEGMTVMDLIAAGGYYTEVLSLAVGESGKVYAQNPPRVLQFRDGANETAISARLANNRLPNVSRINAEMADVDLPTNSLDAVITALNFHDIYNGAGKDAALDTSSMIISLLKPGGVFGVIDHKGSTGNDNASLHRIEVALVKDVLTAAGFTIEESELLANPGDDHTKGVFDPAIRGNTDRFLIRARKPVRE